MDAQKEYWLEVTADGITSYRKSYVMWQMAIGDAVMPTLRRLVVALEMAERWMRSREALKRAVILAGVLFALLVIFA